MIRQKQAASCITVAAINEPERRRGRAWQARPGVDIPDVASSKVAKNRRTSDLSVAKPEMVTLRTGPALEQAERSVEQWDRLQGVSSNRHNVMRVSTLANSAAV